MADQNRRFLRDRADPRSPFQVLRNRRKGFLTEWTTSHKGQVYVASCDGLKHGVYKIGKSTDHFSRRSQALSQPTGAPGFYFPVY
ncbi:MAG: GIY-YIG nuclease family protein, partial [Pseudobdellovibrionaceae bacterium]|nr:GIY-YIG nuclease family protein [Pseudobdellovibrionaceae bacterium]